MGYADKPDTSKFKPLNVEEFYKNLIDESPYITGDSGEPCDGSHIEWIDYKLIEEGREFIRRNSFAISLAHVGALLFSFTFKCISAVLLRTGAFGVRDSKKSMLRHLETFSYVENWYEADFLDNTSEAFKGIQVVRKLHINALKRCQKTPLRLVEDSPEKEEKLQIIDAINKDLDACTDCDTSDSPKHLFTYNPKLFFNQFDMVMTQFGFFSLVYLFPSSLGIRDTRGIEGFVHIWAVIGRMLGLQDQFNLALHPNRELHLKVFHKIGLANLKDMDLTILTLQQTYIDALSRMKLFTTLKASIYSGLDVKEALPNFKGTNMYSLMTWKDKFSYNFIRVVIFLLYQFDFVRRLLNLSLKYLNKMNQKHSFKGNNNYN